MTKLLAPKHLLLIGLAMVGTWWGGDAQATCVQNGGTDVGCTKAPIVWVRSAFAGNPTEPRYSSLQDANYASINWLIAGCPQCTKGLLMSELPAGSYSYPVIKTNSYTHPDPAPDTYIYAQATIWGTEPHPVYGTKYYHSGLGTGDYKSQAICPGKFKAIETSPDGQRHWFCKPYKGAPSATEDVIDGMSGLDATTEGCTSGCNPVNLATGNKYDVAVDYQNQSPTPIQWARTYNSRSEGWTFNYTQKLEPYISSGGTAKVAMQRPDGSLFVVQTAAVSTTSAPSTWTLNMGGNQSWRGKLVDVRNGSGVLTGWTYRNLADELETYDPTGNLLYVQARNGDRVTLTYDAFGRLSRLDDDYGRYLALTYAITPAATTATWTDPDSPDPDNPVEAQGEFHSIDGESDSDMFTQVASVTDGTVTIGYTYISAVSTTNGSIRYRHLQTVTQADGTSITYSYHPAYGSLTGIQDEDANAYATYTYDSNVRVTSSVHGAGLETITYTYTSSKTTVKDALNHSAQFDITPATGTNAINKTAGSTTACTACFGTRSKNIVYNVYGDPTSTTNFENVVTQRTYDTARGLPLTITEAFGTPLARTTTLTWHANFRLPLTVVEPIKVGGVAHTRTTTFTYNSFGKPLTRTVSTSAGGSNRVWTYTYDADGWLETVTEPNGLVTKLTYDLQGNAITQTVGYGTAFARTTTMGGYTSKGLPGWSVDPNGLAQRYTWDTRDRLTKMESGLPGVGGPGGSGGTWETTQFEYHLTGKLKAIVGKDATRQEFSYDTAHRLTQVLQKDSSGNQVAKVVYTLDVASNVTAEKLYDASNVLVLSATSTYDAFNRLATAVDAQSHSTAFEYTADDVLKKVTDPLTHISSQLVDALERPTPLTDALNNPATVAYGPQDEVASATDVRGVVTTYAYNGFGEMTQLVSPDRGTWAFGYDAYGRRTTVTDPRGVVVTTTYDLLSRPTQMAFSDAGVTGSPAGFVAGSQTQTFGYDSCTNGIDRLCSVTDAAGGTAFVYDAWGRVTGKAWTGAVGTPAAGVTLSTGYSFDAAGRLDTVSYPSGKILQMAYGVDGKPTSLTYDGQTVLDQATWTAFDAAKSWRWGAAGLSVGQKQVSFGYDLDGQPAQVQDVETRNYTFDASERLTAIDDPMDVTKSQLYSYDALNRMTSADVGAWGGPLSYGYDTGGNRTSKTDTSTGLGLAYTYGTTHNKLLTTAPTVSGVPGTATSQSYDAMGSLVNDGYGMTLGYDVTGRLVQTTRSPSSTTQAYNAMGQRVRKTTTGTGAGTVVYAYDEAGRMLGAYRVDSGAPGGFTTQEELVSFDGWRIVATVRPDAFLGMSAPVIYPVLSDHLGTPRKVLDPVTGFTRWDWDAKEPFGMQAPNENPASVGVFKLDARFPGQRFDAETGLYHNGFRDYHAGLGRYVQSDPLGLDAGWNTYAYVDGAPMGAVDPLGLEDVVVAIWAKDWWGHVYVGNMQGRTLLSQYPLRKGLKTTNVHLSWKSTLASRQQELGQGANSMPSDIYIISVDQVENFNAAAIFQRNKENWELWADNDGTNCVAAASDVLSKSGFKTTAKWWAGLQHPRALKTELDNLIANGDTRIRRVVKVPWEKK